MGSKNTKSKKKNKIEDYEYGKMPIEKENYLLNINNSEKFFNKNKNINNPNNENNYIDKNYFIKDLISDSFCIYWLDNTFTVFTSIDKIMYLIYTNEKNSIICYDLIDNKKIIEIKKAHNKFIHNFKYYLDSINKRDLLISISSDDNNLKLWNISNFECILNLQNINNIGWLNSACLLKENNKIYIITSNCNNANNAIIESIKIFDLNGCKINEIENSNYKTFFIENYFYDKLNNNYIITGNNGFSCSYDFKMLKIYHKYSDKDNERYNMSIFIQNIGEELNLLETSCDGNIRLWDFHSAELKMKIFINNYPLYAIYLWNNNYIIVGCYDGTIKIIELKSKKIIKSLLLHNNRVLTIKKLNHPKFGECFLSQNADNSHIKVWTVHI